MRDTRLSLPASLADQSDPLAVQDDVYEGMLIPKGTNIYPSLW